LCCPPHHHHSPAHSVAANVVVVAVTLREDPAKDVCKCRNVVQEVAILLYVAEEVVKQLESEILRTTLVHCCNMSGVKVLGRQLLIVLVRVAMADRLTSLVVQEMLREMWFVTARMTVPTMGLDWVCYHLMKA
jgi:hypothetical protein